MKHTDTKTELEKLVEKMMKDATLETPSLDFTTHVMSLVIDTKTSDVLVYKPLISKNVWGILGFCFLALILYIVFGTSEATGLGNTMDYSLLNHHKVDQTLSRLKMSNYAISKSLSYALVFLGFMICLQVLYLKQHFNQRFEN